MTYLPSPLGDGGRRSARSRIKADLNVAGEVVKHGCRASDTAHTEGGDSAGRLGNHELDLAERAAARDEGATRILEETRARGVHGGEVARAEVRPVRRGEGVGRGVEGKDEAGQVTDGDVELIISGYLLGGDGGGRHCLYPGFRKKTGAGK
jgi:hypothetical protein